jgi:hypothetical protein
MKTLLFLVLSLICNVGTFGSPLKVYVSASSNPAKEIAKSLEARLKATERYTTLTDSSNAQLIIAVACFDGKEVSDSRGYICSYLFTYYPDPFEVVENNMGSLGLITGSSITYIAENIFTTFVDATTIDKLEEATKRVRLGVTMYCNSPESDQYTKIACHQTPSK